MVGLIRRERRRIRHIASVGCGVNALSDLQNLQNLERIRYQQGYLMRRGHLTEGFERFNALQMRGDILEFVRLLFVPDNLVIMMQLFRCPLAVKRFIITRQNHQATIAILLTEVGHLAY